MKLISTTSNARTFILLIGVILLLLIGCSGGEEKKEAQLPSTKTIKIGAIYPLTGPAASFGDEFLRGVELAVQSAQESGKNVELYVEDSKTDAKGAIAAYNALKLKNVNLILTTISSCALAIAPFATEDEIILFADAAHPSISGMSPFVFRHSSTAEQEAEVFHDFLLDKPNINRVGVLWINDDYGEALQAHFKKTIKNTSRSFTYFDQALDRQERNPLSSVQQILANKPDIAFVVGFGTPMGLIVKALREQGFNGEIVASMGFSVTPSAAIAAGQAAAGVYHTQIAFDHSDPAFHEYQKKYTTLYGQSPKDFSMLAHNSAFLLLSAAENNPKDVATIIKTIHKHKEFVAPGERMLITQQNDILPPVRLVQHP